MPANTESGAATTWSVLITGPTGSGRTRELGRHLSRATGAGATAWAAVRGATDRAALAGLADISRMAATAAETAAMISDARAEMERRYALIESGSASTQDFTWLVIAIDDYDSLRASGHWDWEMTAPAERPVTRAVDQVLAMGRAARIAIALTGGPGLARDGIFAGAAAGIPHISLPVPHVRRPPRGPAAWLAGARRRGIPGRTSALPAGYHERATGIRATADPAQAPADPAAAPVADQVSRFLYLVRTALRCQHAHLAAAAGNGPPSGGDAAAACGWNAVTGGGSEPSGPCIGTVQPGRRGDRVYLFPLAAYEAARSMAAALAAPFTLAFPQLTAAVRDSGLLQPEDTAQGQRPTVLRCVCGGRFRVWDLPADAVLTSSTSAGDGPETGGIAHLRGTG